jgi:glucose/arabinose dehydrogenase
VKGLLCAQGVGIQPLCRDRPEHDVPAGGRALRRSEIARTIPSPGGAEVAAAGADGAHFAASPQTREDRNMRRTRPGVVSFAVAAVAACAGSALAASVDGLTLAPGFSAQVVHEGLGAGRHLAVGPNGDIYLASRKALIALRDTSGDGVADEAKPFGDVQGTGIQLFGDWLYVSDNVGVYRYALKKGELVPKGARETVVAGFPRERQHGDKTFALDPKGTLYINVGAPSNSCQERDRQEGSLGMSPCPILEKYAGVWVFDGTKLDQTPANGRRYSTGIRNAVAIEWNAAAGAPYVVIHGRDSLDTLFPKLYDAVDNATRTAEEFHKLTDGGDFGWPSTFWDTKLNKRVVAPEYGGDGKKLAAAGKFADPLVAFPAHWAPNDLVFYSGKSFPAKYQDGAFIAFHGSWNRAPEPQAGYKVVFQPMKNGKAAGEYETFVDGFAGELSGNSPNSARYRPTGLAVAPDGSLLIADSQKGRIWRVRYDKK